MTKLLFCRRCTDIVAPHPTRNKARACRCGTHVVWWEDPQAGQIRVHDTRGGNFEADILGIHNGFLSPRESSNLSWNKILLDTTPDTYLFKKQESVIVKLRPGESSDSRWVDSIPEDVDRSEL